MMKLILFLVALAVFDLNEIDSEVITWKIWENSSKNIIREKLCKKHTKIEFNPANTYIVVKYFEESKKYNIYYLMPKGISTNLTFETLKHVLKMRQLVQINGKTISIIRETRYQESSEFRIMFPQTQSNTHSIPLQRLYRVSEVNKEIRCQQIPLHFSELNLSDAFVFDSGNSVILFSVNKNPNRDLLIRAKNIGHFIFIENQYSRGLLDCFFWVPENNDCYTEFISNLEESPEENGVIKKISENTVEEMPNVHNYQLFSPLSEAMSSLVEPVFVIDDCETLNSLTKACYIFTLEKIKEAFIYIRNFENEKEVEKCLKYGEVIAVQSTLLVSVVEKTHPIIPFLTIFKEIMSMIWSQKEILRKFYELQHAIGEKLP